MTGAKFTPSYEGMGEFLRSAFMEAEMRARAEKIMAVAQATAPYDANDKDGDHYRDHFHITSTREGGIKHDRAEARVVNDHVAAFQIEYGTEDTPRHRTLGRAADAGLA
jgi:hypothetical protein